MSLLAWQSKYLFLMIPLFIMGLFFIYKIYLQSKQFNSASLSKMRNYEYSRINFYLKNIFLFLSFILLIFSVLRPAWGEKKSAIEVYGSDIIFTLDVSKSMNALDFESQGRTISRLQGAKEMIADFVAAYPQNRYGLVVFAGESFVSTPLTIDLNAFLTFLEGVDSGDVAMQGTNIAEALKASIDRFYSEQDKTRGRSIVLISDGGEKNNNDFEDFFKLIKKMNIAMFTIGVGGDREVPIPDSRDFFGRAIYKQYKGKTVMTKLEEGVLKQIADKADGKYFRIKKKDDLKKINQELKKLKATAIKSKEKTGLEDRFQYFLFPALLFFLAYIFVPLKSFQSDFVLQANKAVKKYLKISMFILIIFSLSGCTENKILFRFYLNQGNQQFVKKNYQDAREKYKKASENSSELKYISENNYAIAEYKEEKYEKTIKKYEELLFIYCKNDSKKYCDQLYYNLGNAYYRFGEEHEGEEKLELWKKAIEAYKKTLEINSSDKQAQENIDFILEKINKQNKKQASDEQSGEKNNSEKDQSENSEQNNQKNSAAQESDLQNKKETNENNIEKKNNQASKQASENSQNGDAHESGEENNDLQNNAKTSHDELDEEMNNQINAYLQSLENKEKNNQKYFKQNSGSVDNNFDPFDDFFNDSFFQDFFNDSQFGNDFRENENSNEIDW